MLPELGQFALILALLLSGLQAFFGIFGPMFARDRWVAAVTPAVAGQFVMLATAVACLIYSFISNDFSVLYIAENSNSALPLFYRVTAMWGAHEGSLLLWIFILSCWTVAVSIGVTRMPARFGARVLGVLGVVSFGFLLFTLATSNPFTRLDPPAPDGRDLNPVLQDPALAIHPPILYTGYVGFAVAFAFACAAMLEGRLDQQWARWTRPWTTAAWAFLSCGIALGSWWAYYELGWGGYWFWDPVENASFMPWLVGTALIHSLAVTDKRGLFKSWTLLLAVLELAGHLPRALGRSGLRAFLCGRPTTRHFHSGLPRHHDRRSADPICLAGAEAQIASRFRPQRARVIPPLQQHPAGHCGRNGLRRYHGAAHFGFPRARYSLGRRPVLQPDLHAVDVALDGTVGTGRARQLETRATE
jgi:cytochrome c biogenesis factor